MDSFKFKGMANTARDKTYGKPASVRAMGDLSIQQQQKGTKRSFSEEDSSSSLPLKRGKTADSTTAETGEGERMQASGSSRAMQAVWDQAHLSRCAARLRDLQFELAAARTQSERDSLQNRVEKLQRSMKEDWYDGEAMQLG